MNLKTDSDSSELSLNDRDSESVKVKDNRKQSLYFPEGILQEMKEEAARLDRSMSWVVQRAWKIARAELRKIPSVNDVSENEG